MKAKYLQLNSLLEVIHSAPRDRGAGPRCRWADMNADGRDDDGDIQQFVAAMTGA